MLIGEGGAEVNLQDAEGITALHWACSVGSVDAVELLIGIASTNLNVMEVDGEKLTPLDYSIIGSHQEVAQILIERGALSISSIRELAATMIQRCWRGYWVRKEVGPKLAEHRLKLAAMTMGDQSCSSKDPGAGGGQSQGVESGKGLQEVGHDDDGGEEGGVEEAERREDRDDQTAERMRSVVDCNYHVISHVTSI